MRDDERGRTPPDAVWASAGHDSTSMTDDAREALRALETELGAKPPPDFARLDAPLLDELTAAVSAARAREAVAIDHAVERVFRLLPSRLRARARRALVPRR